MKLDKEQVLNVLYQGCVLGDDSKTSLTALASNWLRFLFGTNFHEVSNFNFSATAERNSSKLFGKQVLNILYHVCFSVLSLSACVPL